MQWAAVDGYIDDPINPNSQFISTEATTSINNIEPVSVIQNIYEESIIIKEFLIDSLQGIEIIPIDNNEYKNDEIDEIITKIESFSSKFFILQDELDKLHREYNEEKKNTSENINKIDSSIKFMKKMENDYKIDDSMKDIIDKINEYSKKIHNNDKLNDIKKNYSKKRKELNSYLYFIQKLNKWNMCNMCPMCFTNKVDVFCNPCGHTGCRICFEKQSQSQSVNIINNNKCPFCREYIIDLKPLYYL